jgi:hypothetical protein
VNRPRSVGCVGPRFAEELVFVLVECDGQWLWALPPRPIDPVEDPYGPFYGPPNWDHIGRG